METDISSYKAKPNASNQIRLSSEKACIMEYPNRCRFVMEMLMRFYPADELP